MKRFRIAALASCLMQSKVLSSKVSMITALNVTSQWKSQMIPVLIETIESKLGELIVSAPC